MKLSIHFAWGLGLVAALAGCGGGGGGGETTPIGNSSGTTTVSGVALNSYLENATVFLDVNGDGVWNTGEPFATTNAKGEFSFPSNESMAGRFLVVKATTATKMDGSLLTQGMTLMTPAEKPSVISPLTTEVVAKMKNDGVSFDTAKSAVQSELGLDASLDVMKDYIKEKASNPNYAKVQNVSSVVSDLLKTVETQPASTRLASLKAEIDTKLFPILSLVKEATDVSSAKQKLADRIQEIANNSGGETGLGKFQAQWIDYAKSSTKNASSAYFILDSSKSRSTSNWLSYSAVKDAVALMISLPSLIESPPKFSIETKETTIRLGVNFYGRNHDAVLTFAKALTDTTTSIQSIQRTTGAITEIAHTTSAAQAFPTTISEGAKGILFVGESTDGNGSKCADTSISYETIIVASELFFNLIINESSTTPLPTGCVELSKRTGKETFSFKVLSTGLLLHSVTTLGKFSYSGIPFEGVALEGF